MFFGGRLMEKLTERMKVVVWLDSKGQENLSENRLREMFCGEIFRLRPERMLLPEKDIRQLADIRLSGRSAEEKDHIAAELRRYFGGFPAGICYALDLMANGEKRIPVED